MSLPHIPRIVALSNVFDQQYHDARGEVIERCLSASKRRDLFRSLELASGREVLVLSSPPKATVRRSARWLPSLATKFSTHTQLFCGLLDAPKVRIPLSWITYAWHVVRNTRDGDLVILDNYEFIYVVAALVVKMRRRLTFVLDYEDGKHLIDRSWPAILSWTAEMIGRHIIGGAMLAHPRLGDRVPAGLPTILVPGFITGNARVHYAPDAGSLRFLYSGSLDATRGVDLLLDTIPLLPPEGWALEITGAGPLAAQVAARAAEPFLRGKVTFHGSLPPAEYAAVHKRCHVGLNCQRSSDPISNMTFPSKVFSYLSAGLVVLSSKASAVEEVCGKACIYFSEETPQGLSAAMQQLLHLNLAEQASAQQQLYDRYSIAGTAGRLQSFLDRVKSA